LAIEVEVDGADSIEADVSAVERHPDHAAAQRA